MMLDANKTSGTSPGSSHVDPSVSSGTSPTNAHTDPNCSSGSSPTPHHSEPDFLVENHFTLFLLFPLSDAAKIWVDEHLPPDRATFGEGVVIEARYFWRILEALQAEGYTVVPR
jgi:hypothetical protein